MSLKGNIMSMTRELLVENLKSNVLIVNFTKVNGEERKMLCTLHENVLPEPDISENPKKENLDVVSVWDLDNDGWRSFRFDSIIHVRKIEGVL